MVRGLCDGKSGAPRLVMVTTSRVARSGGVRRGTCSTTALVWRYRRRLPRACVSSLRGHQARQTTLGVGDIDSSAIASLIYLLFCAPGAALASLPKPPELTTSRSFICTAHLSHTLGGICDVAWRRAVWSGRICVDGARARDRFVLHPAHARLFFRVFFVTAPAGLFTAQTVAHCGGRRWLSVQQNSRRVSNVTSLTGVAPLALLSGAGDISMA